MRGQWVSTVHAHPLIEPWSGKAWVSVQHASTEHVDEAVASAHEALAVWSEWPGTRKRYQRAINPFIRDALVTIANRMREHHEQLAYLESTTGKPIRQARGDIDATIECFKYFAGMLYVAHL